MEATSPARSILRRLGILLLVFFGLHVASIAIALAVGASHGFTVDILTLLGSLAPAALAKDRLDRAEDRADRREDRRDRREDVRDARHNNGALDRLEDRLDRAENRADRRENRRDRRR